MNTCCFLAMFSLFTAGCVTINTATLQTGRVLASEGRADVGLVAGGGESAQMPVALAQYRFPVAPGREMQLRWTIPGWPQFSLKEKLAERGALAVALLSGIQYSQVDRGTHADGSVAREHRFDMAAGLPVSLHSHGGFLDTFPLSPFVVPQLLARFHVENGLGFTAIPSVNLGVEAGRSGGGALECGLWYQQGLNWQVGVATFF